MVLSLGTRNLRVWRTCFRTYCYRTWNSAQGYVAAWVRGVWGRISLVQLLCCVWLFSTPWNAARQASLSITNSWSWLKLLSVELVMPSNYLILCRPFSSCLQSFPESGSFPVSQLFPLGGQSIGPSVSASALVLPVSIQGWYPLESTGLTSLLYKGLLRFFSSITIWHHQFLGAQPSLWSRSHICTLDKGQKKETELTKLKCVLSHSDVSNSLWLHIL